MDGAAVGLQTHPSLWPFQCPAMKSQKIVGIIPFDQSNNCMEMILP
jgi:hypothetical protein